MFTDEQMRRGVELAKADDVDTVAAGIAELDPLEQLAIWTVAIAHNKTLPDTDAFLLGFAPVGRDLMTNLGVNLRRILTIYDDGHVLRRTLVQSPEE